MKKQAGMAGSLGGRGYRLTPQRLMIVEAIEGAADHVSAEDIFSRIRARYPYVNISTVYRTLELLKGLGLVIETDFGEGRVRYHPAGKGHHHHLVCSTCGDITPLDESALQNITDVLAREYGFAADLRHLAIFGRCARCREKADGRP